jgi:hypothetical protein
MNLKIECIIEHAIFLERNNTDYNEYKTKIMNNIININLNQKIVNYIPCDRSLHLSRPRMRTLLYKSIVLNNNLFEEVGHNTYEPKEQDKINNQDIYVLIEELIKILVKKQQGK